MYRQFFVHSPVLALPVLAMVIFMAVFAAVSWRTLRRKGDEFDQTARLPMADADEEA